MHTPSTLPARDTVSPPLAIEDPAPGLAQSIFRWRFAISSLWLLAFNLPSLLLFLLVAQTWLWQPWALLPSLSTVLFLCAYLFSLMLVNVVYLLTYTACLPVFKTRLAMFWNLVYPENLLASIVLAILGAACAYSLTELSGQSNGLWHSCEVNRLIEREITDTSLLDPRLERITSVVVVVCHRVKVAVHTYLHSAFLSASTTDGKLHVGVATIHDGAGLIYGTKSVLFPPGSDSRAVGPVLQLLAVAAQELHGLEMKCLDERLLFCAVYGAIFGFGYGCSYFHFKENFLVFPSIQRGVWFRLSGHLRSHLREGLLWTLKVLRFFYPIYYLCGSSVRAYVLNLMGGVTGDGPLLDSVSGLLDVGLLVHLIFISTFMHFTWSFALRIFRICQTQAVVFPVIATFAGEATQRLEVALESDILLLKLLGYLDLYQLSLHSIQRRKQIFSLTVTGQPLVWETVSNGCLQLIREQTERLATGKKTGPLLDTSLGSGSSDDSLYMQREAPSTSKGWPPLPSDKIFGSPGATRRRVLNEKARLWSYSPGNPVENVPVLSRRHRAPQISPAFITQLKSSISSLPKQIGDRLKQKPFFMYFLNELPETTNQELFSDCQLQVWAITSISELAIASYTEDTYGVVQRSLSVIIEFLIDLSQVLDRHVKAPMSNAKSTRSVCVALETNGKYAVKTAVQTALFRLAFTFAKERRSIHLSNNHSTYWSKYFTAR